MRLPSRPWRRTRGPEEPAARTPALGRPAEALRWRVTVANRSVGRKRLFSVFFFFFLSLSSLFSLSSLSLGRGAENRGPDGTGWVPPMCAPRLGTGAALFLEAYVSENQVSEIVRRLV